jgi:hypothetical protein
MVHEKPSDVARAALRAGICTICYQRPRDAGPMTPSQPRVCEPTCTIFAFLDTLERIAVSDNSKPGEFEHAMREQVCSRCTMSATAGDYCAEMEARTCPLSRYAPRVLEILEDLQRRGQLNWKPAA